MKYPVGIQSFSDIIQSDYVYVDKTDLVYSLAKEGKIYFLSRPRRFGKSLLLSTLESYFLGRKELFKGLKIEKLEKEWKQHAVFRLDFNGINFNDPEVLQRELNARMPHGRHALALSLKVMTTVLVFVVNVFSALPRNKRDKELLC